MSHALGRWIPLVTIAIIVCGCARPVHLPVIYQLPAANRTLKTETVGFEVIDTRTRQDVLGPAAKKELPDFTNQFTLYQHHTVGDPIAIGSVDTIGLFDRVFRDYLTRWQIPIAAAGTIPKRVIRIDIQRFELERVALKWLATIDYTASVLVDGKVQKSQTIQGNSERLLIVARKDATRVLSGLVTDVASRLDMPTLLIP